MNTPPLALILACLVGSTFSKAHAQGQQADPLFDKTKLHDFRFTFKQAGWWNLLLATESSKVPLKADLVLGGVTYPDVGVHIKGNTSARASNIKKPFNLSMDQFKPDQRLHGYKTINLNNAYVDPTFTREVLTYELMEKYMPTPRTGYARVFLNGTYWGCYVMVEQLNKDFLRRYFDDEDGVRFKGDPPGGAALNSATLIYRGSNPSSNYSWYELKTSHTTAWNQLQNTIVKLNRGPGSTLRADVQSVINVDRALWYFAACNVIHNMDSYLDGGHNYYMYFDPRTGLMNMIPWDGNMSFGNFRGGGGAYALDPLYSAFSANRPLMSRLMTIWNWKQRYVAHIKTILAESYHWSRFMKANNDKYQALIDTAVRNDPNRLYSYASFKDNLTRDVNTGRGISMGLKPLVDRRRAFLLAHPVINKPAPTITEFAYSPANPSPAQKVWVRAKATVTGGVHSVSLFTSTSANANFARVAMFDDGAHRDGNANDGIYGVSFDAGTAYQKTRFYIRANAKLHGITFEPQRAAYEFYSVRAVPPIRTGPVMINEVLADNGSGDLDEKNEAEDWLELINTTNQAQDLTGRYLTDDFYTPKKWAFPSGTKIPANGFLRVWCDNEPNDGPLHATFKLSDDGEEVFLIDTDSNNNAVLDAILFARQKKDRSFGNVPDGGQHTFYIWKPSGNAALTGTGIGRAVRFDVRRKGSPSGVDLKSPSTPKVGNVLTLQITSGPPNSPAILGLAAGVQPIDLGTLGPLILDTASLLLVPVSLNASGSGGLSATLPANLGGVTLFVQAAANELTNAMIIRISR